MNFVKSIFYRFPLEIKLFCREHMGYKNPMQLYNININLRNKVKDYIKNSEKGLTIRDGVETWHNSFKSFLKAQPKETEVAIEFFSNNIKIYNLTNIEHKTDSVILLCVVKNDLLKIKNMVKHHRGIGVNHFAIIDNGSTDGTKEWLSSQKDVDLFYVEEDYTTNRREAWLNRLVAYYGLNRWYLILDSDELFTYYGMESKGISSLIKYCEENSLERIRSIMIDMYADDLFYSSNQDNNYVENCRFFDLDSYRYIDKDVLDLIVGGPRGRLFNQIPWLTKYPLCYFTTGDIQGKSHFPYPYNKNKKTKCITALLHYKFLPSDIKKYREIAAKGNYFNGSTQYKDYIQYIDNKPSLSFINEQSREFTNTDALFDIPVLEKIKL